MTSLALGAAEMIRRPFARKGHGRNAVTSFAKNANATELAPANLLLFLRCSSVQRARATIDVAKLAAWANVLQYLSKCVRYTRASCSLMISRRTCA